MVVAAVEKVPAPNERRGHAVKPRHGFFAADARIAVLPVASGAEVGGFLKANVATDSAFADRRWSGVGMPYILYGSAMKPTFSAAC